jgi:hypothetical protein
MVGVEEATTVNRHVSPATLPAKATITTAPAAAVVTASYAADFERCRLLCDTMDRHVAGATHHYLLVEHRDVKLFRALESSSRVVIDERELLPSWLKAYWDPSSRFRRRIWLSLKTPPLRGWHVQQLRRIAIAEHIPEEVLVFCDSDVAFVKPFDLSAFLRNGRVRLFRRDDGLVHAEGPEHRIWHRNAAAVLGIGEPQVSPHDYISTLIAWRRRTVIDMCRRVEIVTGRDWIEGIVRDRRFSECTLYGRYVDEVTGGADHFHGSEEFCRVQWSGRPQSDAEISGLIDAMSPEQVAVGMQSFIGTDIDRIRRLVA